ncbi:MAG: 3-oxoacyl-ACP synthase [Bacteroidota bacterium]
MMKEFLLETCEKGLNARLSRIQKTINDIETSLNSETKSTAGDKHETGRAMLQLEREKAGAQLKDLQRQQEVLGRIQIEIKSERVALGSLVITNKASYFMSTSLGEIKFENQIIYAISLQSPIGQLLMGKSVGDITNFRGVDIQIDKIL